MIWTTTYVLFLLMIGHFSWLAVALMTASKMIGALVVAESLRRRA